MSNGENIHRQGESTSGASFDDRVDVNTRLTNREVIVLLGRSLRLLASAKGLFACKTALALLALIPGLFAPWTAKIIADQVLLRQPLGALATKGSEVALVVSLGPPPEGEALEDEGDADEEEGAAGAPMEGAYEEDGELESVKVPSVLWRSQADAERAIGEAGLVVGAITSRYDDTVPEGLIAAQDPPSSDGGVRFPPHFIPFVNFVRAMEPMETMLAMAGLLAVLLLLFGRGPLIVVYGQDNAAQLAQGQDSATQSENKINAGSSGASGLLGGIEVLVNIRLTQRLANSLRTRLFRRLARLPMTTLDDHRIGDSVFRVMYDAPDVALICYQLTLTPALTILGAFLSLFFLNYSYGAVAPELIWAALAVIPIALLITLPASGVFRRINQDSRASGTATTNAIEESMSNIQAVQSLGGMEHEKNRIEGKSEESFRRFRFVRIAQISITVMAYLLIFALALFITVFVSNRIIDGVMTPGDFGVLFGLTFGIGGAALGIGTLWIAIQANVAAVRRVFFFIDAETEDPREGLVEIDDVRQGVRFENVEFSYPNGHRALQDIDLDLSIGELVAIVGPTGAGKTSLAYLIPGYYHPTQGRVLIDGNDVAQANLDSVRAHVSYVFQEHLLLNDSIRNNLLFANPHATEEDILQACRTSGAMEFIDELPEGIDTVLGASGDTLSVGQKQRVCIARGLIRDTKILILDEPTAALDPRTENALVRALLLAAKDRLVIVIAHRLSTIRQADRIIFLEDGQVKDIGDHEALMQDAAGPYRRFVELQGVD